MKEQSQMVITISRQFGSGGAYIGQQLAQKLGMYYLDRQIVSEAAKKLSLLEENITCQDERAPSFWQSISQSVRYSESAAYIPPQYFIPTDKELFETEAEIIKCTAKNHSAVIIGRCGSHILRDHPNHISLFFYSVMNFRKMRIQELYHVSGEEACKMIAQSDIGRARYHHKISGREWTDATQYDLSIDTGKVGVDRAVELVLQYLAFRNKES